MVTRPTAESRQQRLSQAAVQEAHHSSDPMHTADTAMTDVAGADARAAELPVMSQQGSVSAQQAQQAMAQMSAPLSLPPSMVRIAAALPPMQQQVMVRISACLCLGSSANNQQVWQFALSWLGLLA